MANAAEKLPMQEPLEEEVQDLQESDLEEIEDMTDEAVREKDETEEALGEINRIGWTKKAEKRNEEAAAKRKAEIEFKHLEASEKMGKTDRLPNMTDQTKFADPKEQAEYEKDKKRMLQARKDIFLEKKAMEAVDELEAEENAEKASSSDTPPKKRGFLSRLFGRK